jgi:hypothetical protein
MGNGFLVPSLHSFAEYGLVPNGQGNILTEDSRSSGGREVTLKFYTHPCRRSSDIHAGKKLTDHEGRELAETNRLIADDTLISYEDYRHRRRSHFLPRECFVYSI